ncbi:hypothetical protein VTO42DRAFT_3765 [Malbranchea cinnamomea]
MDSHNSNDDRKRAPEPPKVPTWRDYHEDNFFIAFRRYADEQISSLLHAVTGLPSSFFAPSPRDWLVFHDAELTNALSCWRHPLEDDRRAGSDGDSNRWSRHRYASHAFPSSIFDTVFDSPVGFGSASFFRDFSLLSPFMFDFFAPSTSTAWPISYLLFSPYSPLHLERQQQVRRHKASDHTLIGWFAPLVSSSSSEKREVKEPRWREAFEDLLRLENGKEMLDWSSSEVAKKEESGKDWLAGMISRGSLGDGWTHVRSSDGDMGDYFKFTYDSSRQGEGERNDEGHKREFTELDVYDSFLHQVNGDFEGENGEPVTASPLLNIILEERRRHRRELEELQKHWREMHEVREAFRREREAQRTPATESAVQPQHTDKTETTADVETKTVASAPSSEDLAARLVSTVTRTERRTLPDGSIRTRTTVNKRFADGREENYETEEVNDNNHTQKLSQDEPRSGNPDAPDDKPKGGWFWK